MPGKTRQQQKKKKQHQEQQEERDRAPQRQEVPKRVEEEDISPHQLIDSLAYIDIEYSENTKLRSTVLDLVETEMALMAYDTEEQVQGKYLGHLPSMEDMCKDKKYISMDKYEPIHVIPRARERLSHLPETLEQLKVQFEYQRDRLLNLQLMERYGVEAWRAHGETLEMNKQYWLEENGRRMERVHAVNMKRRYEQTEMAKKIQNLRHRWKESSDMVLELVRERDIVESQNKRLRLSVADTTQQLQQQQQHEGEGDEVKQT